MEEKIKAEDLNPNKPKSATNANPQSLITIESH